MFETVKVDVPCPDCGTKNPVTLKKGKPGPTVTCAGCGKEIQVDSSGFNDGLKKVDKSIASFKKNLGKRR